VTAALRRSPAQSFFEWRASRRLVVLAYHDVPAADTFAWHVAYVREYMHPVSLPQVVAAIRAGRSLPRDAVLITFDDGDRTVYDVALPILRDWGVPAVTFVIPGLLDSEIPFWWYEVERLVERGARETGLPSTPPACVAALKRLPDNQRRSVVERLRKRVAGPPVRQPQLRRAEVATLAASGVSIGNHTYSHPCLDRCTDTEVESEIVQAHDALTEILGAAPSAFAYPNGMTQLSAARVLRALRYDVAFLFDHRIGAFPPNDPYAISRIRVSASAHPDRFRLLVSGLHSSVHRLMGRP
jgi:peptidoglycan/xylan/chitin deacetylase (PgdA/CDA1 family)